MCSIYITVPTYRVSVHSARSPRGHDDTCIQDLTREDILLGCAQKTVVDISRAFTRLQSENDNRQFVPPLSFSSNTIPPLPTVGEQRSGRFFSSTNDPGSTTSCVIAGRSKEYSLGIVSKHRWLAVLSDHRDKTVV